MNSILKKAIFLKKKFLMNIKNSNSKTWEKYRAQSTFLDSIKRAQVTPLHKKNNPMDKTNYRPVSILTVTSKFMKRFYHSNLVLILKTFLKDWRAALDNNEYVAAVLMDLSKAFDCLPHKILLSKLSAYGWMKQCYF